MCPLVILIFPPRIDSGFLIKVADETVKLPVKWLAPECLSDGKFSEKTDVVKSLCADYLIFLIYFFTVGIWSDMLGGV